MRWPDRLVLLSIISLCLMVTACTNPVKPKPVNWDMVDYGVPQHAAAGKLTTY